MDYLDQMRKMFPLEVILGDTGIVKQLISERDVLDEANRLWEESEMTESNEEFYKRALLGLQGKGFIFIPDEDYIQLKKLQTAARYKSFGIDASQLSPIEVTIRNTDIVRHIVSDSHVILAGKTLWEVAGRPQSDPTHFYYMALEEYRKKGCIHVPDEQYKALETELAKFKKIR
jgi:hypothetical protein